MKLRGGKVGNSYMRERLSSFKCEWLVSLKCKFKPIILDPNTRISIVLPPS